MYQTVTLTGWYPAFMSIEKVLKYKQLQEPCQKYSLRPLSVYILDSVFPDIHTRGYQVSG